MAFWWLPSLPHRRPTDHIWVVLTFKAPSKLKILTWVAPEGDSGAETKRLSRWSPTMAKGDLLGVQLCAGCFGFCRVVGLIETGREGGWRAGRGRVGGGVWSVWVVGLQSPLLRNCKEWGCGLGCVGSSDSRKC